MSSKPFAALPATTALGATLLGLSATLFTVDVGGTLALDRERAASGDRTGSAIAASTAASIVVPAGAAVAAAPISHPPRPPRTNVGAHPASIALIQTPVRSAHVRRVLAKHDPRIAHVQAVPPLGQPAFVQPQHPLHGTRPTTAHVTAIPVHSVQPSFMPTAVRRTPIEPALGVPVAEAATSTRTGSSAPEPSTQLVTLRDVRRFVMRDLKARDKHVCVISAMTYAAGRRQVIVDLVFRDDKGRWFEKAVVRRGGTAMKLVGVKERALPYKTVASTGIAHNP